MSKRYADARLNELVADLELSTRAAHCLSYEVVDDGNGGTRPMLTVGDLLTKSERELLRIPNFGRKSLYEVKEELARRELRLGMELPPVLVQDLGQLAAEMMRLAGQMMVLAQRFQEQANDMDNARTAAAGEDERPPAAVVDAVARDRDCWS